MKANVLTDWEKLEMQEVPKPELKPDEARIRVLYGGVCGSDVTVFHHRHMTATVPRIMCHEILGVVEEIRSEKPLPYQAGDRVVIHPLGDCGVCDACLAGSFHVCENLRIMGLHMDGGFAEYVAAETKRIFPVPADIPDKVAILTEPLAVGFHACSRAGVVPGDSVLIIGGGPIGILTGVCARYFGAARVVIAEVNRERLELLASLGFETIDSGAADLAAQAMQLTGGKGFERVFEASGSKPGALALSAVTKIRGVAVLVGIPPVPREYRTNQLVLKEIELRGCRVHTLENFRRTLEMIVKLYRAGAFPFARMSAGEFPLERLEEAIALQESGTRNGKILIKIGERN